MTGRLSPDQLFRYIVGALAMFGPIFILTFIATGSVNNVTRDLLLTVAGVFLGKYGTVVDWCFGEAMSTKRNTPDAVGQDPNRL